MVVVVTVLFGLVASLFVAWVRVWLELAEYKQEQSRKLRELAGDLRQIAATATRVDGLTSRVDLLEGSQATLAQPDRCSCGGLWRTVGWYDGSVSQMCDYCLMRRQLPDMLAATPRPSEDTPSFDFNFTIPQDLSRDAVVEICRHTVIEAMENGQQLG